MNVVITLPEHLIRAIMWGEKFIEVRSKVPLHFDKNKDVVFVVQKGSDKVPLYFTITRFFYYDGLSDTKYIAKNAAVSVDYINNYRKGKKFICSWVIGCACKVDCPFGLYSDLKIYKNPQSFIYRDYEWRQIAFTSYEWLNKPNYFTQKLIPILEHNNYMRSLSSAKPSTL